MKTTEKILAGLALGAGALVNTAQAWPTVMNWPVKRGEASDRHWSPGEIAATVLVPVGLILGAGLGLWACSRREQAVALNSNEEELLEQGQRLAN